MFCTIRERKNKYKQTSYNVLLCERKKEDGKVKSSDKFIVTLTEEQVRSGEYILILNELDISDSERKIITTKVDKLYEKVISSYNKGMESDITIKVSFQMYNDRRYAVYDIFINRKYILYLDETDFLSKNFESILRTVSIILKQESIDELLQQECLARIKEIHLQYKFQQQQVDEAFEKGKDLGYNIAYKELEQTVLGDRKRNSSNLDKGHLKKIFRVMSKEFHPDSGGSEEIMVTINTLKEQLGI